MKMTSQPIVFFGTEDFSLGALKALVESGFNVAAVVTKPDSPQGRGHRLTPPKVKVYAEEHGIPVWQPSKLSEINDKISHLDTPAGVLVSYGKIIPQSTLDLFTPGIINVHPSLLPKYRGPSPIETAIIMGDHKTGVSIMKLISDMDAGPVYKQIEIPLSGDETATELYHTLGDVGSELLVDSLPSILDGSLIPVEQDDDQSTYCNLIKKSDGIIDWSERAEVIVARIRAYQEWPKSRATLGDVEVIITKAEALSYGSHTDPGNITLENDSLIIGAGRGSVRIQTLKPLGKKEMPVSAFLAGYRFQLGL